jgi:hypothetical protein
MTGVDLSGAKNVIEQFLTRPATWLVGFVLLVVAGLLAPLLVRRLRWAPLPTLLTLLAGVVTGAVTLAPRRRPSRTPSLTECVHTIGADLAALVPPTWQVLLNLVLFAPLMFFATLASRRPRAVAVFALIAPLATEVVQGYTQRRICSAGDFVTNALGGLAGVVLATGWLVWLSLPLARAVTFAPGHRVPGRPASSTAARTWSAIRSGVHCSVSNRSSRGPAIAASLARTAS